MKLQFLAALTLVSAIAFDNSLKMTTTQAVEIPAAQKVVVSTKAIAKATVKSGSFVSAEVPTMGTAQIVTENGQNYLQLGQNFKTRNGPDLYVIIYRSSAVPDSGLREGSYVNLGRLQNVKGSQRYAIPGNVNLGQFNAAAIWCRRYNATFGYASLGK
ncbi:MAG: DM13 domain-containing protein [Cyanosarcina radialis HA8281-LM2]|jgi:hypothetical protein|nr:DM13 domain-containing protein [Cyanosarcina radialis HA8281-LM2]